MCRCACVCICLCACVSLPHPPPEHANDLSPRLEACKRRFEQSRARLLRLVVALETLRAQGYALQTREDELRKSFERLLADLARPDEYRARLAELQTRVLSVSDITAANDGFQLDRGDAARLAQTLEEQRRAHAALIQVIIDDERAAERIARALTS